MPPISAAYDRILQALAQHEVEFIVVGGVGAVLHGAPIDTFDVDVVHRRTATNIERLIHALEELDAVYRMGEERRLRPTPETLAGPAHHLLRTPFGDLDLLGEIDDGLDFDSLSDQCEVKDLGSGLVLRVLNLDALIRSKQRTGRPKDMWAAEILKAVRDERNG